MENGVRQAEEQQPSTSSMLPAQPKNGTMKTYENPRRTFTRPYSAKTVYFYKEGDFFFTGIRLPISKHRYKTLANLMDELNHTMYLPYGVRNITTPMGRTNITSLDQLQHLGRYVASSSNPPKGVDLDKIQEKYSASLRREPPQRSTAGGHAYWMPTTPTLPARINVSRVLHALNLISAKQVFFVLNGKGKFHRSLINPMKMPKMEQLLEECSSHLEVAIHRLFTPEGKLITTVEEILAYDGPRIIACPRNERPHLNEKSASTKVKLPEINPSRYAPRQPLAKIETVSSSSAGGSVAGVAESSVSSGNSIEKRERLPIINNRYVPRKRLENGVAKTSVTSTTTSSYVPKSYQNKSKPTAAAYAKPKENARKPTKEKDTATSSAASNNAKFNDSGNGNSISSSQQSERAESMTERKAQMIREELRANLNLPAQNNSDHYSEEDMIREEESDYDHAGIHSGTDNEDEPDSALGSTEKQSRLTTASNGASTAASTASHRKSSRRIPARETPSSSGSERASKVSATAKRVKTMSRQDTPYVQTPSRQNTGVSRQSTSETSEPRSNHSSRPSTAIQEASDEEDLSESENEEENEDEIERDTPAIHTPDTRKSTAMSRRSTAHSTKSFESDSSKAWSRVSGYSDKEVILPSDEEEDPYRDIGTAERERLDEAATKIQAAYKGYSTRKRKVSFYKEKERRDQEKKEYLNQFIVYTIEILLGARFGLDFDTQLYVILHGEDGECSEKIYTEKVDWLYSDNSFYEQDTWIVRNVRAKKLGVITKIDVGHEKEGYGAGTYIERVVITEGLLDGRRFLFEVEKWFDSGQVDGLIERTIKTRSFMYQIPFQDEPFQDEDLPRRVMNKPTKGRWRFLLHTLDTDMGGTTSNLHVIAYCQYDSHSRFIPNESGLRSPGGIGQIDLDLGRDIGSLRKIRFELDKQGDKPNYYLKYVEAFDYDTKERCVMIVDDWLLCEPTPGYKKWQPFREVAIFSKNYYPSAVKTYEGTVTFADHSLILSNETPVYLQYFTESQNDEDIIRDSSGLFPIVASKTKSGSTIYSYKVEFVTMDAAPRIRVIPNVTALGKDILNGLFLLNGVYDEMAQHGLMLHGEVSVGDELFIETITQKRGDHVPYSSIYGKSSVDFEQNNAKGPFFKELVAKDAIPYSTAKKHKKGEKVPPPETSQWELFMSLLYVENSEPVVPSVVLVTRDRRTFEMECEMSKPEMRNGRLILKYTITAPYFGNPHKIRCSCEAAVSSKNYTHVLKVLLTEMNLKTQVFIKPEVELDEYETVELECTYPDVGENKPRDYELHIRTIEGGGNFRPFVNIIGDGGDTGYRAYPGITKFESQQVADMYVISMNLKTLRRIEVWAKTGNPENWKGTIRIITGTDELVYQSGVLELSKNGQIALSELEFIEQIEPVVSGESYI